MSGTDGEPAARAAGGLRLHAGGLAQLGALLAALLASACCWLPLVLLALGLSGGALAARFEAWRPVVLPLAFALLAVAFYLSYRRPRMPAAAGGAAAGAEGACSAAEGAAPPSAACCTSGGEAAPRALRTANRAMLWVVSALVLAFALFPEYAGWLLASGGARHGGGPAAAATASTGGEPARPAARWRWTLRIEGMSCAGCAAALQARLAGLEGVAAAAVDYERGQATVLAGDSVSAAALRAAVAASGYELAAVIERAELAQGGREP
ncbi:MAG: hypothetical protein KatS3mg102_2672 [Planctomycetota bacterium]|nr:MAG: hypothetical protein KatS3mg102_2672 [Planctomycetota bacterium]